MSAAVSRSMPSREARRTDDDPQELALTREPLGLAAVPERGDLGIGRGGAAHHLVDGCPSLEDRTPLAGQHPEPPTGIGLVAHLLHPGSLEDRRRLDAAGDGDVDELGEERALGAEDGVDRFGRHVGALGDRVDGGRDVAPLDEQRPGRLEDGVAAWPAPARDDAGSRVRGGA